MAKSRKIEPETPLQPGKSFQQTLLDLTSESPLLVCGIILSRTKQSGKNERGEWTMHRVEVRGAEGRVVTVIVNDPASIPPRGDFAVIPGSMPRLRRNVDARDWNPRAAATIQAG